MPTVTESKLFAYLRQIGQDVNPLPEIADTYRGKKLVVCGDAACVWDDLRRFGAASAAGRGCVEKPGWDFMTVNRLVETFPGVIEHIYSNEPALLRRFVAARRQEYEFPLPVHSHSCNPGADHLWPFGGHGTSGLGGVLVGIGLGYEQIVLCGLPLDDGSHNGEPPWRKSNFTRECAANVATGRNQFWALAMRHAFDGRVRSMSGRTMEWLGVP